MTRRVLPLFVLGFGGVGLVGFGVGGLSGVEPQLQRASQTVELERRAPAVVQDVDCPWQDLPLRRGEV